MPPPEPEREPESLETWGFADTHFFIDPQGDVQLSGQRYALCGQALPDLLPWIRRMLAIDLPVDEVLPSHYPPAVPESRLHAAFVRAIQAFTPPLAYSAEPLVRLRHGHGHAQEEQFAIHHAAGLPRLPDWVVFPASEAQVEALVQAAVAHHVCLIPFGGGTNVSAALRCPSAEQRMIVSVDMRRMDRLLWLDPVNRLACVEAGMVGRHLVETLRARGWSVGHEPDSIEFSTVGGWIATNASGMKKNRYGNIEDLVQDMHVVTAKGMLQRQQPAPATTAPRGAWRLAPRESVGSEPQRLLFGSEGNLGIITQAVLKLSRLAPCQQYGSVLFPNFAQGVAFMYDLAQTASLPASVRLVDNVQFQFGLALKPRSVGMAALKSQLEKWYVTKLKGFDPTEMVACTLVFEGSQAEVQQQMAAVYRLAKQHSGMPAGAHNGARGYQLTFSIAYIRDLVMRHHILAESFETSVPWEHVVNLCTSVKACLRAEHTRRQLPGKPFLTCRVTQIYGAGACIYFYFGFYFKGVAHPSQIYSEMEALARAEILRCGGSLSHHHGVGKLRRQFMPDIMSPTALEWLGRTKASLDPHNIFGCGNL